MVYYDGSGLSHDRKVTLQELKKDGGDFLASVSVEGRGSLVYVEGFSNLVWKPLFFPHHDVGVIQSVALGSLNM